MAREVLRISKDELLLYSSETKAGRDEVWQRILDMIQDPMTEEMAAEQETSETV